jgi:hypothetical protein
VYIVVSQTQKQHHPLCPAQLVTRAYAYLTRAFANYGYDFVFVNFADAFGVACLGLGASGFATGPSQSLRRLCLAAFLDEGGGLPLPHLYSHPMIGEFLPERELEVVARLKLLRRVQDDTVHSGDLFRALQRGQPVESVSAWAENKNNVSAASRHFIARMITEASTYSTLTPTDRFARAESWLEGARVNQENLNEKLAGQLTTEPVYAPVKEWLADFRIYAE